jgi:LPXTG-site transpeptidase (sortase) family protein
MDDTHKHSKHFDASMPLPDEAKSKKTSSGKQDNAAAELIRQKVQAAYASEPNATEEVLDEAERGPAAKRSKHQQFIYDLTNSGKSPAEIQQAWHEYYAGLTDGQKHEVWQEFNASHGQAREHTAKAALEPSEVEEYSPPKKAAEAQTYSELKDTLVSSPHRAKLKPVHHFQSLLFGLGVGSVVVLIFLFSFFNERFIAPLIQPSRNITDTPIISDAATNPANPEVIIPKINAEIPVVYDVKTINDAAVENALESGVVHYADTALPGQDGNLVIVGHSSNNIFNKGRYKFAFVLLSRLENGDTFYLTKDGKRYTYQVYKKQIVKPTDVSVLGSTDKPATATLITCDPPGTSTNRLVVVGEQISPNPSSNLAASTAKPFGTEPAIIPGNSPSLWSRLANWFAH